MKRSDALRIGSGSIASLGLAPAGSAGQPVPLSQFAFAVAIGPWRAVGVLADTPELIDFEVGRGTKRMFVPQASFDAAGWQPAVAPASAATTETIGSPGNDVQYGHIADTATGLCRAKGGVYIGMTTFSRYYAYLVFYRAADERFFTYALQHGGHVMGLFFQPGKLYYAVAGDPQLPLLHSVDAVE